MAKKSMSSKDFLAELAAFADEQRQLIDVACEAFPVDHAARDMRVTRVQNDFRFFVQTYFPHYVSSDPSVFHEWAFDRIPKLLDSKHGQRIDVSAPRGEAKSTLLTQLLPLWCIVTKRRRFMPIVMDTVDQARSMLEAIKVELESNPRLLMDFPDSCGKGRVWNVGIILTKTNIKLQAFGSGKRMRGLRHGPYRPDLVILDDLENDENVVSKEQRDKLERWLRRTVMPLGPPDGSMDILYLNTILHYDSVANRMHRDPMWRSKKFKAIIEFPIRLDLWQEWEEIYLNEGEDEADDFYSERRAEMDDGAVVSWPSMRPLLMLMKLRAADHFSFHAEYQNEPDSDEDAPFKDLQYWIQPVRDWLFFGANDPALGKKGKGRKKNDPAAILIGALDRNTGILDVVEADIMRMLPTVQMDKMFAYQREYNCLDWYVEAIAFQEFYKDELIKRSRQEGIPLPVKGFKPNVEKHVRIMSLQSHIRNGTIRVHPRLKALIEHLLYYPQHANDEGPDTLHMLYTIAYGFTSSIPHIITGKKRHGRTRH